MKILTIGGATQDIFISYEQAQIIQRVTDLGDSSFLMLEEGKKLDVENVNYSTGGGATNAAVSFSRLGFNVASFFKIGADCQGDFIINHIKAEGVQVTHALQKTEVESSVSFIITCNKTSERTALVYRGASSTIVEGEIPFEIIKDYNLVYITTLSGESANLLSPIAKEAKKHHCLVAVNPGSNQLINGASIVRKALSTIDILMFNFFEAMLLRKSLMEDNHVMKSLGAQFSFRDDNSFEKKKDMLKNFFLVLQNLGSQTILVTDGNEGVYVAHEKKLFYHPSLPAKKINTLGAGDAFGSCFAAQLLAKKSIETAIRAGSLNSKSVIEHTDAKAGLLTEKSLLEQLEKIDQNLLQKFELK